MAPNISRFVFDHVKNLNREQGIAIIIVEQNAKGALNISDRAIVLNSDQKAFEGSS